MNSVKFESTFTIKLLISFSVTILSIFVFEINLVFKLFFSVQEKSMNKDKREIKYFTEKMNQSQFSARQVENEEKALEWVRVSFEMLTKAVLESLTNPEFLFQTTFFAGVNPKTNQHEIRLMTFNLDMTFLLLEDNNLRVLIYNKKPGDAESELKPALTGDYSFRKREIFDHFINLLSAISKGMHA